MTTVEQSTVKGGASGKPEEAKKPAPPNIVAVIGGATVCTELSRGDVLMALRHGMDAPHHLGAVVAAHCAQTMRTDPETSHRVSEMEARIGRHKTAIARAKGRQAKQRIRQAAPPQPSEEDVAAAGRYKSLVGQAQKLREGFDARYQPGGRLDMEAVGELHDRTDALDHPAVNAVEAVLTKTSDHNIRAALITANRIVRFAVDQAAQATLPPGAPAQ